MLCDENILWSQAVFEVFYSPGKFSLCGEVFGWLLAFWLLLSFGRKSFDRDQGVLSGCACMFAVGCSCLEELCTSGEAVTHVFEASFVFSRHLNMPRLDAWLKEATV